MWRSGIFGSWGCLARFVLLVTSLLCLALYVLLRSTRCEGGGACLFVLVRMGSDQDCIRAAGGTSSLLRNVLLEEIGGYGTVGDILRDV